MVLKKQENEQRAFNHVQTLNQLSKKLVKEYQKYHNTDFFPHHTSEMKPIYNKM